MTKSIRIVLTAAVAIGLAAPAWAGGQAVARGGSSSSSSSSSGGSSGGSSGSSASSGGGQSRSAPSSAPTRSAPSGSRTGATAQSRSTTASGSASPSRVGGTTAGVPNGTVPSYNSARYRNGSPTQGTAVPRGSVNYPVYPIYPYYPGYWYPFYGGFGYGYGYGYYDPWYSGAYAGYGYGGGYGGGGYSGDSGGYTSTYVETGSIRLKANVETAKVYIDGALMGVVDDFDGLGHHLDIAAGSHELQLRADGYETFTSTISVEAGKTLTERVSLNKKK